MSFFTSTNNIRFLSTSYTTWSKGHLFKVQVSSFNLCETLAQNFLTNILCKKDCANSFLILNDTNKNGGWRVLNRNPLNQSFVWNILENVSKYLDYNICNFIENISVWHMSNIIIQDSLWRLYSNYYLASLSTPITVTITFSSDSNADNTFSLKASSKTYSF